MKRVLDPCCGSRMFWFDHENPDVCFCDIREVDNELIYKNKDGGKRYLTVKPDILCDVTALPFENESFWHVVFDPPHLTSIGENAWMCKKYGRLSKNGWREFIHDGFEECWRCLKPNGTLIFKWNETDISVKDVLSVVPYKPLYGHKSGKYMRTHWIAFIK